jgi:hypothetical protein
MTQAEILEELAKLRAWYKEAIKHDPRILSMSPAGNAVMKMDWIAEVLEGRIAQDGLRTE